MEFPFRHIYAVFGWMEQNGVRLEQYLSCIYEYLCMIFILSSIPLYKYELKLDSINLLI